MEMNRKWGEIPKRFYSDLENKPFEKCTMCERSLLEDGVLYLIEKAIRSYGSDVGEMTLFEYAICLECAENYRKNLSRESLQNIDKFYAENIDFSERSDRLKEDDLNEWMKECLVHQKPAGPSGEVQIYALCNGKQFSYGEFPYMIRSEAMDELIELISAETLDELDSFKNNLTSGPPELRELLDKAGPRLLI